MSQSDSPRIGLIMGSQSDWPDVMRLGAMMLEELEVPFERKIVSAHRTPDRMFAYARAAEGRGLKVIIAGAGGAAHLPGMIAALTHLPVIGVPVQSKAMSGVDSLYSIAQMPPGVPVGCMAINGAKNAALFAASILALTDPALNERLLAFRKRQTDEVGQAPVDNPKGN